ncbi:hypothetical protein Q0M94_21545 (plasmid) [Deinococcus radiomollis]|uniref:hypothetical protein n=1 Tax=Deinococcus radiomollis TaxID=468916 RepID=UPI0038917055
MCYIENEDDLIISLWQLYAGQGVTENELIGIEKELGGPIPVPYRTFLALVGNTAQAVPDWIGSEWLAKDLVGNKSLAEFLLEQNPYLQRLPSDAFVFWGHQGYSVFFVRSSLGDISLVYNYLEGDEPLWQKFRVNAPTLDYFMLKAAPKPWQAAKRITEGLQKKG